MKASESEYIRISNLIRLYIVRDVLFQLILKDSSGKQIIGDAEFKTVYAFIDFWIKECQKESK